MKLFIIVPIYNEGQRAVETINKILKKVKEQIILVDDGSNNKTLLVLKKKYSRNEQVIIANHLINLGKGAAMKTGIELAWQLGGDAVVFIDADGQHNPKHLPSFINALKECPIVFGYRELNNDVPWIRKNGNKVAGFIVSFLFNIKRKDLLCGFLGFRKSVYKKIRWSAARYGIETEMATKVGKNKINFCEVKIDTIYLDKYKGVSIFDAFKILFKIPFWYFSK